MQLALHFFDPGLGSHINSRFHLEDRSGFFKIRIKKSRFPFFWSPFADTFHVSFFSRCLSTALQNLVAELVEGLIKYDRGSPLGDLLSQISCGCFGPLSFALAIFG